MSTSTQTLPTILVTGPPPSKYTVAYIKFHYPVPDVPPPPSTYVPATPKHRFGPVPDNVGSPKLQAPAGARFSEELNAFVPENTHYSIRGYEKRILAPTLRHRLRSLFGLKNKPELIMAMGLTHSKMSLISLEEAQSRPDIVYRPGEGDCLSDEELASRGFSDLITLDEANATDEIRLRSVANRV